MNIKVQRIIGNWLTAFISPLIGTSIAFNLPLEDINTKILFTAIISSSLVTGLIIARSLENAK